jgi:hypothetical protein
MPPFFTFLQKIIFLKIIAVQTNYLAGVVEVG